MWNILPTELKEKVVEKSSFQSLQHISLVNKEFQQLASARLKKHLMEEELENIVKRGDAKRMGWWKKVFFDKLSQTGQERAVLLSSFFYLMGKHQQYSTPLIQCFDPFIIPSEHHDFYTLGRLINDPKGKGNVVNIQKLMDRNPEVHHPLFGKITVQHPHFQHSILCNKADAIS